jgi:hypothetical protein
MNLVTITVQLCLDSYTSDLSSRNLLTSVFYEDLQSLFFSLHVTPIFTPVQPKVYKITQNTLLILVNCMYVDVMGKHVANVE